MLPLYWTVLLYVSQGASIHLLCSEEMGQAQAAAPFHHPLAAKAASHPSLVLEFQRSPTLALCLPVHGGLNRKP